MSKYEITAQFNVQAKPGSAKRAIDKIKREIKAPKINLEVAGGQKAAKDIKNIANATKNLAKEAKATESNVANMSKMFGSALKNVLRYDIARRVFYAFAGAIEQGVKDAISFEREMVKISQVSGQTMQQLKGLERTVSGLATSLGVSSSSLVRVGLILKQTGLSVKDTEIAMQALAKTELAPTFDNIADTAETAVAAMRQFGLASSQLEGLLGKINTVAANFAVEASDIGVAIKRAGGAFRAAGGEVEELIALFTSVRSTTRETAETIATGFRTIFTRLQRPTTIKFLRQFGIELTDLNGKFVGPYESVMRLNNALANLDPRDVRFSAIVEQLGGFRQVSKVIPLIQQASVSQAAYNAQMKAADSLSRDAETAQQSLAVQMQKLTEEVKELFREMADSSSFQAMVGVAMSLAKAITAVGKAIAPVIPLITALFAVKGAAFLGGKFKKGGLGGLNAALGRTDGRNNIDLFGTGGKVHKFSNGGWVPGTGNSDTVPALLEPGEFVLRKSAAQAFGPALNGINKYRKGGPVLGKATYNKTYDGDSYNIDATPLGKPYAITSRLMDWDAPELPRSKAEEDLWKKKNPNINIEDPEKGHPGYRARAIAQRSQKRGKHFNDMFFDANGDPYGYDSFGRRPLFKDDNLVKKLSDEGLGRPMNKGGRVPALLTPGEFVVNKQSAQSIGYNKLAKMNRYNAGGKVAAIGGAAMGAAGSGLMDAVIITSAISSITSFAEQTGLVSGRVAELVTEFGGTLGQVKGINAAFADMIPGGEKIREFGFLKSGQEAGTRLGVIQERLETRRADRDDFQSKLEDLRKERDEVNAAKKRFKEGDTDALEGYTLDQIAHDYSPEIKDAKRIRDNNQKRINSYEKEEKEKQKAIRASKMLTLGLEVAGAAAIQAGNALQDAARKAIAGGDFSAGTQAQAAAGGALSMGAHGAMMGMMTGAKGAGIWGAAAGAVIGLGTAIYTTNKQIQQVKFGQTLQSVADSVKNFQAGLIDAGQGLDIIASASEKRRSLDATPEEAKKALEADQAAAETFIKKISKNVSSVTEFDRVINQDAKSLKAAGVLRSVVVKKLRDEIEQRLESERKLREYTIAQREATAELLRLKGIGQLVSELKGGIQERTNIIAGTAGGMGPIGRVSSVFENTPRSKAGIKRFNDAIDAIGDSGADAGLNEFTERVKANAAVSRELEGVLSRVADQPQVGAENIEEAIIKDLNQAVGPEVAAVIKDDLKKALQKVEITNIGDQKDDITEVITGVFKDSEETFKEFASLIDERNAFLKNSYQQLQTVERSYIASLVKVRNARVKAEQGFIQNTLTEGAFGESDASVQARFFARLDELAAPGRGIKGTDVSTRNIKALGDRLIELQKQQRKANTELAQPNRADMEAREKLIKSSKDLATEIDSIKSILNEYGNSQQRLTALNEELARAQKQQNDMQQAADRLIFGSASESNEAAKDVSAIAKAMSEGTLMGLDDDRRLATAQLFKTGTAEQRAIYERDVMSEGRKAGISDPSALLTASKDVLKASKVILQIEKESVAALEKLSDAAGDRVDGMASTIEAQNKEFLKDLKNLFYEERVRQVELEKGNQQIIVDELQKQKEMFSQFGDKKEQERYLRALKSESRMRDVDTLRRTRANRPSDEVTARMNAYLTSGSGEASILTAWQDPYEVDDLLDQFDTVRMRKRRTRVPVGDNTYQTRITDNITRVNMKTGEAYPWSSGSGKLLFDEYDRARVGIEQLMKASKLEELTTKKDVWVPATAVGYGGNAVNIPGYMGRDDMETGEFLQAHPDMITNLQDYAKKQYSSGAEASFLQELEGITAATTVYASEAVENIVFAMAKAQKATNEEIKRLEQDKIVNKLATDFDAAQLEILKKNAQTIESIKSLNDKYGEAAATLEKINKKLQVVYSLNPNREQLKTTAKKVIDNPAVKSGIEVFKSIGQNISGAIEAARSKEMERASQFMENLRSRADKNIGTGTPSGIKNYQDFVSAEGQAEADKTKELIKGYEQTLKNDPNNSKAAGELAKAKIYLEGLYKEGVQKRDSIAVHDSHAVPVLQEILQVLKGQGQTGAAGDGSTVSFNRIDTTELDRSINTFSGSIEELAKLMSGPIQMEVGGEINVNVNLTGAEILQENEGAIAKIAANKVTQGINNFVRNGLRSTSIAIKGDWTA